MNKLLAAMMLCLLAPLPASAEVDPHLYGCYFSQGREPGEWVTSTAALLIEKAPKGILIHGSVSSGKNSWISTPDGESPVLLKQVADRRFIYAGTKHPNKSHARCELVLHYDEQTIYISKYHHGCKEEWNTGDGIGPSQTAVSSKQPNADMCLSYLGINRQAE